MNAKWSVVVVVSSSDIISFTRCIRKLAQSISVKRTQVIISGYEDFVEKWAMPIVADLLPPDNVSFNVGQSLVDLYNSGAKRATAEYICFVDTSVVVSNNFLLKLTYGLEQYGRKYFSTDAVMVGPITNQNLPHLSINATNVDQIQEQIDKQPEQAKLWAHTSTFTRFCFLVKADVWCSLELDPALETHEPLMMIDFVNRVYALGHVTTLGTDTLVFADGVIKDNPGVRKYYLNKKIFPETNEVAVLYRIKIGTEEEWQAFIRSLDKSVTLGGKIFVLDDNSRIKVGIRLREERLDLWEKITHYEKFTRSFDEKRDWNVLISWALKVSCNWVLALEGDEVLEDKFTVEKLAELINPIDPKIFGYTLNHYYLWADTEHWRMDDYWGKETQVRLGRLFPNREIMGAGSLVNKCGYLPSVPKENIRNSSIRVKNYGFVTQTQREDKRSLCQKADPQHATDYDSFLDDFRMVRYVYPEKNTISVYTPVKSGGEALFNWLDHVAAFADEIVVGNDGMTADDVQLVERYGGKIALTSLGTNWGRGRNLILKQCTANWILQLDLDERVNDFPTIQRMIDANQDAWMTSIDNLQLDGTSLVTETIRIFRNVPGLEYWGYLHETVDDAVRKLGLLISYSPVRFTHYGYLQATPAQLWDKMQRYFEINLKQMEDFPMDGRAYYNAALHLLEDNLINDGLRCLEISHALFSSNPLISMELGKTHLKVSSAWFQQCLANFPKESPNVPHIQRMVQGIKSLIANNYCNAPGHCVSYLMRNPVKQDWFRKHLAVMTAKIEGGARKQ